jgi:negative regulator of sigma E activity
MRNYIPCNINRLTIDSITEEGNYQDILFPMKILINIVSNNMSRNETMSSQGLTIIMPMMTIDLLKFPDLCLQ